MEGHPEPRHPEATFVPAQGPKKESSWKPRPGTFTEEINPVNKASFSLHGLGRDNKRLCLSFLCKVESPTESPLRWLRGFPCTWVRQLCGHKTLVPITPAQTGHPDPLGLLLSVALWQSRPPKQEICYRTSIQRTKGHPNNNAEKLGVIVTFEKFQIKRNVGPKDQHLIDQYLPDLSPAR